eukprot:5053184-Pyramimonas_sp.AAC.1
MPGTSQQCGPAHFDMTKGDAETEERRGSSTRSRSDEDRADRIRRCKPEDLGNAEVARKGA